MRTKVALIGLVAGNLLGAIALCAVTGFRTGQAKGPLQVSDLTYGQIDTNNDGNYTAGDDVQVEFLVENYPEILKDACEIAEVNPDGGVNLYPHLKEFTAERAESLRNQ